VYYLSDAITAEEGIRHAEHCLEIIKDHVLDMPVWMDVEVARQKGKPRALTDAIKAFCGRIRQAGYIAGVYTYVSMWRNHMYPHEFAEYELWLAKWQAEWPDEDDSLGMWQQGVKNLETGEVLFDDPEDSAYQDYDFVAKDYPSMILGKPNMAARKRIVGHVESQQGADYCSMNHSIEKGWGGMGTHIIGLGWGCAELCAMPYNIELGTAYLGSCYNFAGDALCQSVNQGGGQFIFVDEPEVGDLVIYIRSGYNGKDYDDYGHIAMYVGDGMVIGAWGVGRPGEAGYKPMLGVAKTTIEAQSLGGGWRYLRNTLIDKGEEPKQPDSKPKNNAHMCYRVHITDEWLPSVRDGQVSGTVGCATTVDALKITPPDGVTLEVHVHIQSIGTKCYEGVRRGKSSGTGSSPNDPIMGELGKRLEAVRIEHTAVPKALKGKLRYRGHVQGKGWMPVCKEGEWCGTRGESKRLEAIEIWYEE
jgi:hypothetical protein